MKEFGGETVVAVWCREKEGVNIYTNYDFIEKEAPIQKEELKPGEWIQNMTMTALMVVLKKQNEII